MNYAMMKMIDEANERATQNAWLKEYIEALEKAREEQKLRKIQARERLVNGHSRDLEDLEILYEADI